MAIRDLFRSRFEIEKERLELEFIKERNEIKLETERKRRDIELSIKAKESELRNQELEFRIQKSKAELEEALGYDEEELDEQDAATKMLLPFVTQYITKQNQPPTNNGSSSPQNIPTASAVNYTDEEIETIIQATDKKFIVMAKGMPPELIKKFIRERAPNIDEDTLNRAVIRLKR